MGALQQAISGMNGQEQPTVHSPSNKPKMGFRDAARRVMTKQQVLHLLSPTLHPLESTDPPSPPPDPAPPETAESKTRVARDSEDYLPNDDDYELHRTASVYNVDDTILSASQKSKFMRRESEKNLPLQKVQRAAKRMRLMFPYTIEAREEYQDAVNENRELYGKHHELWG